MTQMRQLTTPSQGLIGQVTLTLAILATAGSLILHPADLFTIRPGLAVVRLTGECLLLAPLLMGSVALAYQYPIYIRHNTKVCIFTVPLYLMAALLPAPLAALCAGLSILVGEALVQERHGSTPEQILTHTGRWILVALAGSCLAHLSPGHPLLLAAAALLLWLGDLVTLPLVLTPLTGEHPRRLIQQVAKEGGMAEGVQYVVGLVGVLAALHQVWALVLVALPSLLVYLAYRKEVDPDTLQLLESMADAVDLRDPYTKGHSHRVAELTRGLLAQLGRNGQEAALILTAARIHDIGKLGLPDTVLLKEGALSPAEQTLLESYPERGADLLRKYPDFARGVEMIQHHHERWDGRGYPHRLATVAIPFGARIIAVTDAFDAMTSDRPYRRALSPDRAAQILQDGRGRQWDPQIVDAFLVSIADRLSAPVTPLALHVLPTAVDALPSQATA